MSIIGQYRLSTNIASTSVSSSAGTFSISSVQPSGVTYGALLGCSLWIYSSNCGWIPLEVGMLK